MVVLAQGANRELQKGYSEDEDEKEEEEFG
jgi:hypothetical protein